MKKISLFIIAMLVINFLIFINPFTAIAREGEFTIKLGHVLDPSHPYQKGSELFAKLVSEKTNKRVKVNIFPSGQLGGNVELLQSMQGGITEMVLTGTAPVVGFLPEFAVFDLPYLAKNFDEATKLLDGPIGLEYLTKMPKVGIRGLAFWEISFRNIYNSRRPINSLSDLKGLKIRVIESPIYVSTFKALGSVPVAMSFGEVFSGIQQRTIDGAENAALTYFSTRHYEVAKNLALTRHFILVSLLMISEKYWQTLPADIQKAIREAAKEAGVAERKMQVESDNKAIDTLKAAGVTITTPDLKSFADSTREVWKLVESKVGKENMEKVLKAIK